MEYARLLVLALLVTMVGTALILFHEVMLPFVLAALLAYLLAPFVSRLSRARVGRYRLHRGAAILLLYTVFLGLLVFAGMYVVPRFTAEVNRLVRDLPNMLHQVEHNWIVPAERRFNDWLAEVFPVPDVRQPEPAGPRPLAPHARTGTPDGLSDGNGAGDGGNGLAEPVASRPDHPWRTLVEDYTYVVHRLEDGRFEIVPRPRTTQDNGDVAQDVDFVTRISQAFSNLRQSFEQNFIELLQLGRHYVAVVVSSFFSTFLVLMLSAFILADPQRIHGFLRSLLPTHRQPTFDRLVERLDRGLSGVVRGQLMICVVNGTLTGLGIWILGVPFVVTLTIIATVFSLIPIFGVLISTVPIVLMALTVSLSTAVMTLAWILIIHFFEGNFLNPKIMGDSARIHPVLVVFALVVGEFMGGVFGALIAVPVFSVIQNTFLFLKSLAEEAEAGA